MESARTIIWAFVEAGVISFISIAIILVLALRRVGDQRVNACIIDNVAEFGRCEAVVQRNEYRAQAGCCEHGLEEGGLIEAQESDPVPLTNAMSQEGAGQTVNPVLKLRVCPGGALKRQGFAVRGPVRSLIQPITEPDVGCHDDSFVLMPRLWFWTQIAIMVFVFAGIVIAITKLA